MKRPAVIAWIILWVTTIYAQNETGSDITAEIDDATVVQSYPCPKECDCWLRLDPRRVDVACYMDIVSLEKSFESFNRTSFPSTMSIFCDSFDLRHSSLRDGMFASLHAFYLLKIQSCRFTRVSEGVFSGMTSLTQLMIDDAKSVEFHNNALVSSGSTRLELVSITNSGMTRAPDLCQFPYLWGVNFTGNQLKSLTDAGLMCQNTVPSLLVIDLTDNYLSDLPSNISDLFPSLAKFSIKGNMISTLENVSMDQLKNLEYGLDLRENMLTTLPRTVFAETVKLKTLQLSKNNLRYVPPGVFTNLTDITILAMEETNQNDSLWDEISIMTQLRALQLHSNRIQTIPTAAMGNFVSLEVLDLSQNEITRIQNGTFDLQTNLLLLNLSANHIEAVEEDSLRGLSAATRLDIKENDITSIHTNAFLHMASLSLLNASNNRIQTLPKFPESMSILDLRTNAIECITKDNFDGLISLRGVNLRLNRITVVPPLTFANNINLLLLNLGYNRIQSVAYDAFPSVSKVSVLVLDHNNISDLGFFRYTDFTELRTLDLTDNSIKVLTSALFPPTLEEIFLSHNKISLIDGFTFSKLARLRYVDLRMNSITFLSSIHLAVAPNNLATVNYLIVGNPFTCDCRLEWLKRISLFQGTSPGREFIIKDLAGVYCSTVNHFDTGMMGNVPIEHFVCQYKVHCISSCVCCNDDQCPCRDICYDNCSCFRSNNWNDVNIIDCRGAGITSVPSNFSITATWMDLSGNNVGALRAGELEDAFMLTQLYLNRSHIYFIEDAVFAKMGNLTFLDVGYNELDHVRADMFYGLTKLTTLLLNNNKLRSLEHAAFRELPNLKTLSIYGNLLKVLSQQSMVILGRVSSLYLADNPWSCECEVLEQLKNFTSSHSHLIKDFTDVACSYTNGSLTPETYPLKDLYLPDFCLNKTIIYNISHTREEKFRDVLRGEALAGLISTVCIVVLALATFGIAFWQRRFLKLWLYVKFGWKFERKEDNSDDETIYDAFVSYSSLDEDFVVRELVPRLEGPRGDKEAFKLCVHYRDFPVGASIAETIVSSVGLSRRVIIVLSDNFLNSEWCHYEFQTAHHRLLEEKKSRIIMILLHEIDGTKLDSSLKDYLKTRTYVKYGDEWFWEKIEYAMPKVRVADHGGQNIPDVARINDNPKVGRQRSIDSLRGEGMVYMMENMMNYEADNPKGRNLKFDLEV